MSLTDQQRSPRILGKGKRLGTFCCVPGCTNFGQKDKLAGVKLTYHRIPIHDVKRTKLWLDHIRRDAWFPNSSSRICSIHFEGGKKSDDPKKPGYIPTIFPSRQKPIKRRTTLNSSKAKSPPAKRVCRNIFPVASAVSPGSDTLLLSPPCTATDDKLSSPTVSEQEDSTPTSEDSTPAPEDSTPTSEDSTPTSEDSTPASEDSTPTSEDSTPTSEDSTPASEEAPQVIPSRMDHDYVYPYIDETPCNDEVERLKLQLQHLQRENENLKKKTLCISSYKHNDANFHYMTNLPNYDTFEVLAMFLHRRCGGRLNYWRHQQSSKTRPSTKKPGKERTLNFQEELFLVLVRLKRGMELRDMHLRTGVSVPTLSRIFTTWINFMNNELTAYFEMVAVDLSHVQTMSCMDPFPEVTIMLDCTELFSQRSMDLQARKETFSNYKHHDTVKFLVGMGPHQAVNFVSAAWGGRATDKHITLNSEKLMSNLAPGSSVMADRGFLVTEELRSLGVKMIMPHFKGRDRPQFSATEACHSAQISSARIHIERVIQRIKTFHILEKSIRMDQKDMIEQTFRVCSYLVNLQRPILND